MTRPAAAPTATPLAREALALVAADPARGARLASDALAAAAPGDAEAVSVAEQALGIAARSTGDLQAALQHLQRAVRVGRAHHPTREGEARVSLAAVLLLMGRSLSALTSLERAADALRGSARAAAEVQRAGVLYRLGRHVDALAASASALRLLAGDPDPVWEARAWSMRALVEIDLGRTSTADSALATAQRLFDQVGAAAHSADSVLNRGWCAANAGRPVDALRFYDDAERDYRRLGLPVAEVDVDRARLLVSLGLGPEALDTAQRAVDDLAARGERTGLADALLTTAEAALACRDGELARGLAEQARKEFSLQRRRGWVALADLTALRASFLADPPSVGLLAAARATVKRLEESRLTAPALDARLLAGRTAMALRRQPAARHELVTVSSSRTHGPPDQRAKGWYAEALLRELDSDQVGAVRAVRAGIRVLDEHRASLGATELRAAAGGAAKDLATLGQRLALDSGKPARVLEWTERWRANALRMPPVRPPDDEELAQELAELRRVTADLDRAAASGEPTQQLQRRRTALEEAVRRRTRRVGGVQAEEDRPPTVRALSDALGESVLVEVAELDGQLHAVVVADGRSHLTALGPHAAVVDELDSARSTLRRLAYQRGSRASLAAARVAADNAGSCLDALLLEPVRRWAGDRPLVVVPPASLHALPWGLLPSCRSRPVTVAPSAAIWLRAVMSSPPARRRVALIAGPDLPGATTEVETLAGLHRTATVLTADAATAEATSAALDGAALAHVAAHGTFRSDNPLFSALRMADGPLTVYDLERLRRAPHQIVLSACDSGLAGVRAGDELMGLAAALFPLGTAGLIASVVPVPDDATRELMCALHGRLVAGDSLATALTAARAATDGDGAAYAAGASFVSLGAG